MENLSTSKIKGVLQTEHRKAEGKTEDISGIFTVYCGVHYKQKVRRSSLLHTLMYT
jgi:hypothetical protein